MKDITLKRCGKCKEEKPLSEFNKNKAKKDGYSSACRECMKSYTRNHYKENKDYYRERNRRNRRNAADFLLEYKKTLSCEKCGESHIATLDFHHIDNEDKEFNISQWIRNTTLITVLKKEIEKCIVLCANCHRKLHWEERNL